MIQGAGAYGDPARRQRRHLGHDVRAALLPAQTQQDVEHLLRQGLKFFLGHGLPPLRLTIIDIDNR